jgi:RNA polymerase sigma-B factor
MEALSPASPSTDRKPRSRAAPGSRRRGCAGVDQVQRDSEQELLRRYAETHSQALREELVKLFAPLARSLALRYSRGSEPLEDLIQVANLALVKAIDGFDPGRGKPFTAYAVPTILGELRRHFRDNVWSLHLPRSLQELTMAVEEATSKLADEFGRFPTVAQIATKLGIPEEDVLDALRADQARRTMSLDAPRTREDGEAGTMVEMVEDTEAGYDRVEAELASECAGLDERDWDVLRMRFVENMTQYEIGDRLGVSQMQISRIQRRALGKLLAAVQGKEKAAA